MKTVIRSLWILYYLIASAAYGLNAQHAEEKLPEEKILVMEAKGYKEMGKLAALSFILWVKDNPEGVIALPASKSVEYFIKYLHYYKKQWHTPKVQDELKKYKIHLNRFPATQGLKIVQLSEVYPIHINNPRSVRNLIFRYYVNLLGIPQQNVLTIDITKKGILAEKSLDVVFREDKIDLSLLQREAYSKLESWSKQALHEAQNFCKRYEEEIRRLGGIGFVIFNVGIDGSLAYNLPDSSFESKTRLVRLDYPSMAQAAEDIGGTEQIIDKVAITIGLGTLALKKEAHIIGFVSGDAKAAMVRAAVEGEVTTKVPASFLQTFPNAKLYVSQNAGYLLQHRKASKLMQEKELSTTQQDAIIIEIALEKQKAILNLTMDEVSSHVVGKVLLEKCRNKNFSDLLHEVYNRLVKKIDKGLSLPRKKVILHTAPYHDDIMLAYYPLMDEMIHYNKNYFSYLISGYNAVSDDYIIGAFQRVNEWWIHQKKNDILSLEHNNLLNKFRDSYLTDDKTQLLLSETTFALRNLAKVYDLHDIDSVAKKLRWLKDEYFINKLPNENDLPQIKLLKGMMREAEEEKLLSIYRVPYQDIFHLRLPFYDGSHFGASYKLKYDVQPIIELLKKTKPNIITVADTLQGLTPVNHYKTKQLILNALAMHNDDNMKIWAYRNIWSKYKIHEANIFVPVMDEQQQEHRRAFANCFASQFKAIYPNPHYQGDFSTLAIILQRKQFANLKTLLGSSFFTRHFNPHIYNTVGFVYIKETPVREFLRDLDDINEEIDLQDNLG